jgi:hypothetical protein
MKKTLLPERRRTVFFAACGSILATSPTLALLPLRQAHWLSDPPYFMGTGLCMGLSIACLIAAISSLKKSRSTV